MTRWTQRKLLGLAGGLMLVTASGCGSSQSWVATQAAAPAVAGFVITEPDAVSRGQDRVDTVELEAFDAQGRPLPIGGVSAQGDPATHYRVPLSPTMVFPPLPPGTATVELDYLRHGGFALYRAVEAVEAGQSHLVDPDEQPADHSFTRWQLEKKSNGDFALHLTKGIAGQQAEHRDFRIKGVCYSPSPINVLGDGAPGIGDFFFDSVLNPVNGQVDFFNWYGMWGRGDLGDGFSAREDLQRIRELGANTIRVYSMLSRHQNDPVTRPDLPPFPEPSSQYHHSHKQFLDQCWNNGKDPIYVLVGIPLPPDNLYLSLQNDNPAKIRFFDFVFRETIADLANHPAVLGFTAQNEINNGPDAFPDGQGGQMRADDPSTGASNERSDFYWGKVKEHSDYAKQTAPDKLNGICTHDFRELPQYASVFPRGGPSYLEQAANLDFIGVNTYQTVNYDDQYQRGWGAVQGPARKALLFSELGFPATTRDGEDPLTIKETAESRQRTADVVARMLPQAYQDGVSLGACYFEFSDEWWKEITDTKTVTIQGQPTTVRAVDRWAGGTRNPGFPNGWNDEEGFGLFSVARYPGLQNSDPVLVKVGDVDIGPDRRLDRLTERQEITTVVRRIFSELE